MRKFFFQAANGESFPLNGERGVYCSAPAGLGFSLSPAYADLTSGFFQQVADSDPQGTVTFTLTFTGSDAYGLYARFVDFINTAGSLILGYAPGAQIYYRDVSVNFFQKSELTALRWLEVPVSLYVRSPWYLPAPAELVLDSGDVGYSMVYDITYSPDLVYGSDSSAAFSALVSARGHIPASLLLTYRGAVTNPTIRLVGKVSGKTHGVCSIQAVFGSGDALIVSTKMTDSYVRRRSADGSETNLLDALDLSLNPFFRIPADEPCTLTVESDSSLNGTADLQIFYYYRSV